MEIDVADLPGSETDLDGLALCLRSQVCVIGGGIVGLILAHRLVTRGVRVTVLEAGGRERESGVSPDPFQAHLEGRPHAGTREGRVRALGGCSLTWGGQLLPLPQDAGWAVPRDTLAAYEAEAETLLGVDRLPYGAEAFYAAIRRKPSWVLAQMPDLTPRFSKFVPFGSRNLARTLGRAMAAHPLATVVLHAAVTELVLGTARDRIEAVQLRLPAGKRLRLEAEQFVVAAGTVETCRLLLGSRSVAPEGVGNARGQVGHGFHDHLTLPVCTFTGRNRRRWLAEFGPWVFPTPGRGATVHSLKFEPSAHLRAQLGLHAAMAHLVFEEPEGSGVAALRTLLRTRQGAGAGITVWAFARRLPRSVADGLRLLWAARVRRRRYVSRSATVRLQLNMAQSVPGNSRVGVRASGADEMQSQAVVTWDVAETEMRALRRFAGWLREQIDGLGLSEGAEWNPALLEDGPEANARLLAELDDARHAMGGACMGTDPGTSAVDPELRVHGVANLSVASAAVFPDGSAQLPTLTLAALCLRLADRLVRELKV